MKRLLVTLVIAVVMLVGVVQSALATPSTTYWTPGTSDIQPYGVFHITYDSYFTIAKKGNRGDLATDVGLTVGILPYEKLQMEIGFDWFEPTSDPLFFNAKLGSPEGALFNGSPAWNIGIFNVGTDTDANDGDARTDYNIAHIMLGKTLPTDLGRIHIGVYYGNKKTLVDKNGKKENTGIMIGYDKGFLPAKDEKGEYYKWVFAADYASGKNAIGGGGFGIYHYFTRNIDLLTGPVWFNEPSVVIGNQNIEWVWTLQLDINF